MLFFLILGETDEVVFSEFSFAGKESGTDGALIRILSGLFHFGHVIFLMSFQIGQLREGSIAAGQVAFVGSFPGVFAHVLL